LPPDLQKRIERFYKKNHVNQELKYDLKQLINDLPVSLRAEVLSHTHKRVIRKIVFFKEKKPMFNWTILPLLKEMILPPKEVLYRYGDPSDEGKLAYSPQSIS